MTGGGQFLIEADGNALPTAASPGTARTVKLTKGVHGIRLRRGKGEMTLNEIKMRQSP